MNFQRENQKPTKEDLEFGGNKIPEIPDEPKRNTDIGMLFRYETNHGICKYCGENIISLGFEINTCYTIKLKDGIEAKWHPDCYNEAWAKSLMAQRK